MKFLIAALLCSFISAISASGLISSLLESKSLRASSSSHKEIYVVALWNKIAKYQKPHIHCNAALIGPKKLITTVDCAAEITAAFDGNNNARIPFFYATIGDSTNPEIQKRSIRRPHISREYFKNEEPCAIIDLVHEIEFLGADDLDVDEYIENNLELFTYGYPEQLQHPVYEGMATRIFLAKHDKGFVTLGGDPTYNLQSGAPLYQNQKLVGLFIRMERVESQTRAHPRGYVYIFKTFGKFDTSSSDDEEQCSPTTQPGMTIYKGGHVFNFGNNVMN